MSSGAGGRRRRPGFAIMSALESSARSGRPTGRWVPFSVLAIGLASVVLLIATDALRQRSALNGARQLQAMGEIQAAVAISHFWLEEYVSGDDVDVSEIARQVARGRTLVDALLGAAPGVEYRQLVLPAGLHNPAAGLRDSLTEFAAIAAERQQGYERSLPVGIGSPLDVEYDRVFARVLSQARRLATALDQDLVRRQGRSRRVLLSVVSAWSAVIVFAAAALWGRERHRHRVEVDERHSREQLLQAERLEMVGRVAGGLAHDINNYLAAIRGHCELVRMKRPQGDRIGRKMGSAIRTINKASALLDRLLAFSRQRSLEVGVINLNRIVEGLEPVIRPSLGENVHVTTRLAADLWNVEADAAQVEQILTNLLVNARDAMPGGGDIVIATANRPGRERPGRDRQGRAKAAQENVLLLVSDTGSGIPQEALDKIFEPFWTTKAQGVGGGLGLATVYAIVRQSGGEVTVRSEQGLGTTFEITLPRCHKPESLYARSLSSVANVGGDERILLVGDHEEFREATKALLETLGYDVTAVADAEAATVAFGATGESFDLLLCDAATPASDGRDGGGLELVEGLRRRRPMPTILITEHDDDPAAMGAAGAGDLAVVKKQISATRLARKIRQLLSSSAVHVAPATVSSREDPGPVEP